MRAARHRIGRVTAATAFLLVLATSSGALAQSNPGNVSGTSDLNPWSISGALFAEQADGVRDVDIAGACEEAYEEWEAELLGIHQNHREALAAMYAEQVEENILAEALGESYPYPNVPPAGTQTEQQFINAWLTFLRVPLDPMDWVEERWDVWEFVPGTDIPCSGGGYLPSPPNGFFGIPPGNEPPDPDPCPTGGELPFSPAVWAWYPSWHDTAPEDGDGNKVNGIQSFYDLADGLFVFTFIPTVALGWELNIECLPIFPGREASDHFEQYLPAAELTIVPNGVGLTGADTKLWYDLEDPSKTLVGFSISVPHRGTNWTLTGTAWIDKVGWDLDFDGVDETQAEWDEWVDFPDSAWGPADPDEYADLGGNPDEPARTYVFEGKDFYTIATGVTWRGFYVVQSVDVHAWGFTELYEPVTRWNVTPYQVDEIVGRRT